MVLAVTAESGPLLHAIRAVADVIEADLSGGVSATVYVRPGCTPVATLNRSLRGAAHEGDVLRWVMEHCCADLFGPGLFVSCLSPDGTLGR